MFVNRAQNYEICAIYASFFAKKCCLYHLFCEKSSKSCLIYHLFGCGPPMGDDRCNLLNTSDPGRCDMVFYRHISHHLRAGKANLLFCRHFPDVASIRSAVSGQDCAILHATGKWPLPHGYPVLRQIY